MQRAEVPEQQKWRLEDIYETDAAWEADTTELRQLTAKLVEMSGHLGDSAASLLAALQLSDAIGTKVSLIYAYARMRRDEDNTNAVYQGLSDRALALMVESESSRSFFVPELLAIPEAKLRDFLRSDDDLAVYAHAIEEILRQKPHVLNAAEERLLAMSLEMAEAPSQMYNMLMDADLQFPLVPDDAGGEVRLTHENYLRLIHSQERPVRQAAFAAMFDTLQANQNTLASMISASVRKDIFYARVRNYPSTLAMSQDEEHIPAAVYDELIHAVHEALPALHKYVDVRRRALGIDELQLYDLYVPLVGEADVKVSYEEATETVLSALAPLGEEYGRIVRTAIESRWIDVFESPGKSSGAYSWGNYGVHPFVLLNYQGQLGDMFTLAHELGHTMHSWLSHSAQPYVYSNYTLFVAEVASTCNEELLLRHLLAITQDPRRRAYLINHQLESIRGTLFRQAMFAEFERSMHARAEADEPLTPDWLTNAYRDVVATQYGQGCVIDPRIGMEWARISHFYRSFYVYKYATGISAATALADRILTEGEPAVNRYLRFLSSGSSDDSINLLRDAGVDMSTPEPVRTTLRLFDAGVDELARLLGV